MKSYSDEAPDLDEKTIRIYKNVLKQLSKSKTPVLIGGGLALRHYMPYSNDFGDLDVFCLKKDYLKTMRLLSQSGFETWVKDERWLAKAFNKKAQVDIIFGSPNEINLVDKRWFTHSQPGRALGEKIDILSPEHLLWCKLYVQNLDYFAGPDINHLLLKMAPQLDWELVLDLVGKHWELLYSYLINFCFVYPSRRSEVPEWVMTELAERFSKLLKSKPARKNVCRGRLLSNTSYEEDFEEGHFKEP